MRGLTFLLVLVAAASYGQVVNNDIGGRILLTLNESIQSTTAGASVEWKCINKALTNKCLVYHNDQWFTFSVDKPGKYFLNISAQQCRDSKGIQMIVIEGNPCEISTYKILECISQIRTEDVFVELPMIKENVTYLVNVDGFLGDVCEFNLELSDKPAGMPRQPTLDDAIEATMTLNNKIVEMEWLVKSSRQDDFQNFVIYRQQNRRPFVKIGEVSSRRNAYGVAENKYHFTDTVREDGNFRYQVFGVGHGQSGPTLVYEDFFTIEPPLATPMGASIMKVMPLRLRFSEGDEFQIRLYTADGDELLWKHKGISQGHGELMIVDPRPYYDKGVTEYQLLVLDSNNKVQDEIYFRIAPGGNIVVQSRK